MIDIAHNLIANLDITSLHLGHMHIGYLDLDWDFLLAQAQKSGQFNQDVLSDMTKGWNNFVKSGQVWALIIGLVLGYLFRSVTAA
jgi:hypothetical protein